MTESRRSMHPPPPLYVICDRCRAEGQAGEDPFAAFGDLLDFDPVPRRANRADGWTDEVQRAYIAALSLTGTDRAACRAVGKSTFGVNQLLDNPDSAGFRAAREQAQEIAGDERSRRLADGIRAIAAEQAGWRPPEPPWASAATRRGRRALPVPVPPDPWAGGAMSEEAVQKHKIAALEALFEYYEMRLVMERQARIEGRIVEADFYLRQVTVYEICMDLLCSGADENVVTLLRDLSRDRVHVTRIAETTMTRLIDDVRRDKWAELGEPPRPDALTRDQLIDKDGYSLLRFDACSDGDHAGWREAQKAKEAEAARAQVEWEAEARRDALARRDSEERREGDASSKPQSRAEPDGLHPEGDRTDVTKPPS